MTSIRTTCITAALCALAWAAQAQPNPGCGPGAGASAAGANCPAGRMPGGRGAARWGDGTTPGWRMMSEAERREHATQMRGFKSYEECKAYADKHHEQMVARAKERGRNPPAQPRRDPCAALKPN